mmetsp:Transcript_101659/g.310883  ORF Transcript_101659/g.310883 Transcript_101659/m.310883 type:complete len:313 (-) Transcript_101659:603-1541(-)
MLDAGLGDRAVAEEHEPFLVDPLEVIEKRVAHQIRYVVLGAHLHFQSLRHLGQYGDVLLVQATDPFRGAHVMAGEGVDAVAEVQGELALGDEAAHELVLALLLGTHFLNAHHLAGDSADEGGEDQQREDDHHHGERALEGVFWKDFHRGGGELRQRPMQRCQVHVGDVRRLGKFAGRQNDPVGSLRPRRPPHKVPGARDAMVDRADARHEPRDAEGGEHLVRLDEVAELSRRGHHLHESQQADQTEGPDEPHHPADAREADGLLSAALDLKDHVPVDAQDHKIRKKPRFQVTRRSCFRSHFRDAPCVEAHEE